MRILLDDGMQINIGTGIGKYSTYLYQALKDSGKQVELAQFDKGETSKSVGRLNYLRHINSRAYMNTTKRYDVIHFTNYAIPFRRNHTSRYIVTIHDLSAFLHPNTLTKTYCIYNRFITRYALRHADVILTDSESVKREILDRFSECANRLTVAYPGMYTEFCKQDVGAYENPILRDGLNDTPFLLFVGTIEKRKNIGLMIDAFLALVRKEPNLPAKLVLAGRPGYGYDTFTQKVREANASDRVLFSGYLSTNDCNRLYHNAAAYVFPTVYEGFGSTQLECMANNLPLILSDIPTNREISEGYGFFFKLDDEKMLVEQMRRVLNGEVDRMALASVAQAKLKQFQWSIVIKDYLDAYQTYRESVTESVTMGDL